MFKNLEDLNSPDNSKGLNTQLNLLALQKTQSPNMMDVKVYYDGAIEKRLGSNTQNTVVIANSAAAGFSPDSSGVLLTNLTAYWPMNEASGSRKDIINNIQLLDSGGVIFTGGIKNQAALFNINTAQCLYTDNPPLMTGNTSFTLSAWVYLNSLTGGTQRTITSKRDQAAGGGTVLLLHCDQKPYIDNSASAKSITTAGSCALDTTIFKFGTGAVSLTDGSSAIIIGSSNDFTFNANDFTIRFWYYSVGGPVNGGMWYSMGTNAGDFGLQYVNGTIAMWKNGVQLTSPSVTMSNNTWQFIEVCQSGTSFYYFVDGTNKQVVNNNVVCGTNNTAFRIGCYQNGATNYIGGLIDEFEVIKGTAAHTANYTPPTAPTTNPATASKIEHWLFVDTDNKVTFNVSSSGTAFNGTVKADSFGALGTATWYNTVAWLNGSNNQLGISVNLSVNTASYTNGIITASAPFTVGAISNGAGYFYDGRIDEVGYWKRALTATDRTNLYNSGTGNTYTNAFGPDPWASFDFGASALRWLVCAAGTGLYASSNLGVTWVNIATDRTATYQYLDRSKNVMIATSENYDTPLYWAGSLGTYSAVLNNSAPSCKYSINFQGFLILLNSATRKRGFFYNDENTQLTGAWSNNFDIPSSGDDEITAAFVLRRYLYVSTRYKLFRVSYVGGNPDWQFVEIKNWGFVPRTVKRITLTNNTPGAGFYYSIGEVAIGLTYDQKIRIFDGSGDQIISNNIEKYNGQCDFALEQIPYGGSGPIISFAETEPSQNVWKLCVGVGVDSTQTTHFLNYDGRAFAFYPYSNMKFNCMCMAESANRRFLMAFDRSGICHMMDSGNLDGNSTPINEYYDSPVMFDKTPSQSTKGFKTDLFFSNTTSGNIYFKDRIDFSNQFVMNKVIKIPGSTPYLTHYESADTPQTFNTYQFRITSSASTSSPWRLNRYDFFCKGLGVGRNY